MKKTKYAIWARQIGRIPLEGKCFNLYSKDIKKFCETLKSYGWHISQIKRTRG